MCLFVANSPPSAIHCLHLHLGSSNNSQLGHLGGGICMKFRIVCVLLGVVAMTTIAVAQLPTGTILGVVKDATGAIVPGVMLTVTNTETGLSRTTIGSEDGSYRFPA